MPAEQALPPWPRRPLSCATAIRACVIAFDAQLIDRPREFFPVGCIRKARLHNARHNRAASHTTACKKMRADLLPRSTLAYTFAGCPICRSARPNTLQRYGGCSRHLRHFTVALSLWRFALGRLTKDVSLHTMRACNSRKLSVHEEAVTLVAEQSLVHALFSRHVSRLYV